MRHTTRSGFSLLEVMIAASIFLVALAGTLTAMSSSRQIKEDQRVLTVGINLAEAQMEQLLVLPNGSSLLNGGAEVAGPQYAADGSTVAAGGFFQTAWVVVNDTPLAGLRRLTVFVRWIDGGGRAREFTLVTDRT